jgi:aerobic carbon-monoxide dehydrogenase large subunit
MEPDLDVTSFFDPADFNFPFGTHIAVVEVDERSGEVDLTRYIAVNDAGPIGNPLVVNGQFEGSITHAIGQALMERAVYDEQGNLLTKNFMTYAIPRATDVPQFELASTVTPSPHNALGVKGAGEIATVAPAAAIANAVCDALAELGVKHIDMPFTAEKLWRTMSDAKSDARIRESAKSNEE